MSEFTDLVIGVGQTLGWDFVLVAFLVYQLYMPDSLHWSSGTKFKRLMREPHPGVIAALEAVYKQHEVLSRKQLIEQLNGDAPRAFEFVSKDDMQEHAEAD